MQLTITKSPQGPGNYFVYVDRPAEGRPDLWVNTQYGNIEADDPAKIPADRAALLRECRKLRTPKAPPVLTPAERDRIDKIVAIDGDINRLLRENGNAACAE